MRHRQHERAAPRPVRPVLSLRDLLRMVADARRTRLELVCWQFNMPPALVRPAWDVAMGHGYLVPHGVDSATGETMYALSDTGRCALAEMSPRRRRR